MRRNEVPDGARFKYDRFGESIFIARGGDDETVKCTAWGPPGRISEANYCADDCVVLGAECAPSATADAINPEHYSGLSPQPIEVIRSWGLEKDFYRASALTYIARAGRKGEGKYEEDLRKAIRFLRWAVGE